jgi:hypothetical protein
MKRYIMLVSTVLFFLTAFAFLPSSCSHSPQGLEGLDTVCFETQILPLLTASCGKCHSGNQGGEGHDFTSYTGIMKDVTPGNAYASRLYSAITTVWLGNLMPPSGPLSSESRTLIKIWIEQGAKETKCSSPAIPGKSGNIQLPSDTVTFNWNSQPICASSYGKMENVSLHFGLINRYGILNGCKIASLDNWKIPGSNIN